MPGIKSRNWSAQEDQALTEIVLTFYKNKKSTWNEIAEIMSKKSIGFKKTGKQCRQRWTNQLDPQVKGNTEWSKQQNQILFDEHDKLGNRWAQISSMLPGRTDNCVKNHFYSTLRKGLRKINNYIETIKRKETLVKTFKNQILNKVLLLSEGKYDEKFQFTKQAKELSFRIKKALTRVALEADDDEESRKLKEELFTMFSEFSRNCRKKKAKKISQNLPNSEQSCNIGQYRIEEEIGLQENQNRKADKQIRDCQNGDEAKNLKISSLQKNLPEKNKQSYIQELYCLPETKKEPIFVPNKRIFSRVRKINSLNSNKSEQFPIDPQQNMIGSGISLENSQQYQFGFKSLASINSLMPFPNFAIPQNSINFQGNKQDRQENIDNQLIEDWLKKSKGQGLLNEAQPRNSGSSSQLGFRSGASSSFSLFKPEPLNIPEIFHLANMPRKGQISFEESQAGNIFSGPFRKSQIFEYSTALSSESDKMDKSAMERDRSFSISESPLFNQFLQNHIVESKERQQKFVSFKTRTELPSLVNNFLLGCQKDEKNNKLPDKPLI